jgi:hypothetical protein
MMRNTILVAATALALTGCSVGQDKSVAEAAVTQFHQLLDGARYGDIYGSTSQDFRQATSEAQFTALLRQVHDRLGTVRSANQTGWRVNYNGSGHMVTLNYTTTFASGQAREDFIFRVNGSTANLVNYSVNSGAAPAAPAAQADASTVAPSSDGGGKDAAPAPSDGVPDTPPADTGGK